MADRFDLDAIEADDALLDLLAAGGESAWQAGEHDPALMLLADLRLAVEVEGELPVETIDDPESFLARCAALNPVTDPFARKLAARGLALGVAAVAALSVSGVAAAVTGNPLSPYEKVIEKIADGLRPETSLPKEQLDGLPAFDKTKIVKVGKDFRDKQVQHNEGEQTAAATDTDETTDAPAQSVLGLKPPFLAKPPVVDKTSQIETPVVTAPADPDPQPVEPQPSGEPTGQPTTEPSGEPTSQPTTEPSGEPTGQPTEQPSTPETPPPTETTPSTPPSNPPTDNGSTGNPGENPPENPGSTPSAPSTVPSTGTGETGTGTDETSTGTDSDDHGTPPGGDSSGDHETAPGGQTGDSGDQSGDSKPDVPAPDVPTGGLAVDLPVSDLPGGRVGDQSGGKGGDPVAEVAEVAEKLVPVVLPTPTGAPVEEPARLEQYLSKPTGHGKHSSGKPALGWAKSQYAKGKHSTGHYAEGRHAAITRAHGSMAPVTIRQILGVLNTPMSDR
ncbi:hypothetical protein [Kribbella sp. NPDC051620]|uniref:hypothetical protein n=1 Tax=Kribbella sp. NPDC051620 TaxID=3364120 RepID=UPI00379CC81B